MNTIGDEALNVLFREARSYSAWLDKPVAEDTIRQIYEVLKWGPTSANTSPTRFIFLQSTQGKGEASTSAVTGERRENDDCPGYGDYRFRSKVLRKAAPAISTQSRDAGGIRKQSSAH